MQISQAHNAKNKVQCGPHEAQIREHSLSHCLLGMRPARMLADALVPAQVLDGLEEDERRQRSDQEADEEDHGHREVPHGGHGLRAAS